MAEENWLAQVTWAGDQVFVGSDDRGHSVVYDSTADRKDRGISPMRALLTTLGACSGMDVVAILKKRKQKLTSLRVLLKGERPPHGYPKPYTSIMITYLLGGKGIEKKYVEEALRDSMAKFCSVAATLRPGVRIDYDYRIVPA